MHGFALHPAEIANVSPAVRFRVGVDDLAIKSGARNTEPVVVTHNWSRVHDEDNHFAFARFPDERNRAVVRVMKINPLEAFKGIVLLPKRGLAFINVI